MVNYKQLDFESIRPYEDHEIQAVFNRLKNEQAFITLLGFLYPQIPADAFMDRLMAMTSIKQFQTEVISRYVEGVLANTTKGVTVEGLEKLNPNEAYLFISNHRDIVLDPAILNVLMVKNGFNTTEIAIGDNLLIFPWITDLVKLNRTFIVKRNLPVKQMLESTRLLSQYIRYTLNEKKHSIWIAQREGRSKDGNDRTQVSLLKMLNISGKKSLVDNFKELRVVPVSISYEYDPCDYLKASEFLCKRENQDYKKSQEDDLRHMGTGLRGFKGRVHFSFGEPLNDELDNLNKLHSKNDQLASLAEIIDKHVHQNYKLWPGNHAALDILSNNGESSNCYNPSEKKEFEDYIEKQVSLANSNDPGFIKNSMLEMYANPLVNKRSYITI